ncbi:hypothetical protein Ancab_037166 [Ancistrocladus abbreviatus]
MRPGLQVLANVSLRGERQQHAVWKQFSNFCGLLRVCKEPGLNIMGEILRTASAVGFGEDWLNLLLLRICLDEPHLSALFPMLCPDVQLDENEDVDRGNTCSAREQAFLLRTISEILSDRNWEIHVDNPFLREWGIWYVRNLLECDVENQKVVADLELQGTADVLEITGHSSAHFHLYRSSPWCRVNFERHLVLGGFINPLPS